MCIYVFSLICDVTVAVFERRDAELMKKYSELRLIVSARVNHGLCMKMKSEGTTSVHWSLILGSPHVPWNCAKRLPCPEIIVSL